MSPFSTTHGGRYDYNSKGFFATGERTPALALRMTVITEVIGNRGPKRDSTAKGHTKQTRSNEDKENTWVRFNEPGTNNATRRTIMKHSHSSIASHSAAATAATALFMNTLN